MAHKRHKGATEILNTVKTPQKSPSNQNTKLPVAKQLAQQQKHKSKHNEEKPKVSARTECKLEK